MVKYKMKHLITKHNMNIFKKIKKKQYITLFTVQSKWCMYSLFKIQMFEIKKHKEDRIIKKNLYIFVQTIKCKNYTKYADYYYFLINT